MRRPVWSLLDGVTRRLYRSTVLVICVAVAGGVVLELTSRTVNKVN